MKELNDENAHQHLMNGIIYINSYLKVMDCHLWKRKTDFTIVFQFKYKMELTFQVNAFPIAKLSKSVESVFLL